MHFFPLYGILSFPWKSVNSALLAHVLDPDVDFFLDGGGVETGWGSMQHHSGFSHRYRCVWGGRSKAPSVALKLAHTASCSSSGLGGRRTPMAKMLIPKGLYRADWPGGMEGPTEDNMRQRARLQHTFPSCLERNSPACMICFIVVMEGRGWELNWAESGKADATLTFVKLTPLSSAWALVSPVSKMLELSGGQKCF